MKLTASISAFVLVLGLMLMGVFAVNQATVNMGGSISFTATDVYAHITGSIANDTSSPSDLDVTYSAESTQGDPTVWNDLKLAFDSQATPIEVTITVENLSTQNTLRVNLNDKLSSTVENFEKVVENDGRAYTNQTDITLQPKGQENDSTTFTITMSVTNKNNSLTADFDYELNLEDQYYVETYEYFTFEDNGDGTVELTAFDEGLAPSTNIVIPSTVSLVDGVWMEGDEFDVTSIGDYAFENCSGLTEVDLSNCTKLASIGEQAFEDCIGITKVSLPLSLTMIEDYAFRNCAKLTNINLSNCLNLMDIDYEAFCGCSGLKGKLDLSNLTKWISMGQSAFEGCTGLTEIILPSSLTSTGDYAFENCSGLTSITLPSKLEFFGENSFAYCTSLTSITIPASLTRIGLAPFEGCINLKIIEVEEGNSVYHSEGNCLIETATNTLVLGCKNSVISNYIISIDQHAFAGHSGLISITLPSSVTSITRGAFADCSGLETIKVEEGNSVYHSEGNCLIETATNTLVLGCKNSVIPNYITSIGEYAFAGCSGLTRITLPEGVTNIEYQAFADCSGLTEVDLSNCTNLKSIENNIFNYSGLTSITLPSSFSSTNIYSSAFGNCYSLAEVYNYSSLTITAGSSSYGRVGEFAKVVYNASDLTGEKPTSKIQTIDNIKYYVDDSEGDFIALVPAVARDSLITLKLNSRTTEINQHAFQYCSGLTGALDLSNCTSLTSIGERAFDGCSGLTGDLVIPEGVTSIGKYAFSGCYGLTEVDLSNCTNLTSIGERAFFDCIRLTSVTINQYVFENATSRLACGNLLFYITSRDTVLVPANLIDDLHLTNEYLDDTNEFTRSETANEDGYYVYTKI